MTVVAIIDDDDDLRDTICTLLNTAGYETAAFREGREALSSLEDGLRPAVILLDLMMPGMNGWQFRAAQLADATLARIPVIAMSARTSIAAPGTAPLGDVELLRKPFSIDDLVSVVVRHAGAPSP